MTKMVTWGVEMKKMNDFCFGPSWLMVGLWSTAFFFSFWLDLSSLLSLCHYSFWNGFFPQTFQIASLNFLSESFLTLSGLLPGNQRPRLWKNLRENENMNEKPELSNMRCGQSYLYMPYGTYGLGEIRASLIPVGRFLRSPVLQVRARALLSFLRLFRSLGAGDWLSRWGSENLFK